MRGSEFVPHLIISSRTMIRIAHQQRYRRPRRTAFKYAGQDLHPIRFFSRRHDVALPWSATVQLKLNLLRRNGQTRRTPIDNNTDRGSVTLPPCGDLKYFPEHIGHTLAKLSPLPPVSQVSKYRNFLLSRASLYRSQLHITVYKPFSITSHSHSFRQFPPPLSRIRRMRFPLLHLGARCLNLHVSLLSRLTRTPERP